MDVRLSSERKKLYVLLCILSQHDPIPLSDEKLMNLLSDEYKYENETFSIVEIRRMLKFLEGLGLCLVSYVGKSQIWDIDERTRWLATISSKGTQFLAGFGEAVDGVYRPLEV
jgi:type II secretory pathway component PulL